MKYRKLPVVIDAWQWHSHGDHVEVTVISKDLMGRCEHCKRPKHEHGWLETLSGGVIVCPGEWIIKGVNDEYYPCHPEIFALTYEPAEPASYIHAENAKLLKAMKDNQDE